MLLRDEKTMYLLRGLPGSGKTTLGNELFRLYSRLKESVQHISADDYFTAPDGTYKYVSADIGKAHEYCQNRVYQACRTSHDVVIVSNTLTREFELEPYLNMAAEYHYRVVSLVVENRHGNPSIHDVPEKTMDKMRERFQVKL